MLTSIVSSSSSVTITDCLTPNRPIALLQARTSRASTREIAPSRTDSVARRSLLKTAVSSRCPYSLEPAGENAPNIAGTTAYTFATDRALSERATL